ncbi:MAG: hypothetical protein JW757_07220 [Anaerolineales bacterium]|nr:hypothetical protein [Anaerolineales bacterium]
MSEETNHQNSSLRDEFQALGENLKAIFNAAWESEERKKFQTEIEAGMRELGAAMTDFADDIRNSQAGEKLRQEAVEFHERVKSGEVENKAREEIVKVLKGLNDEIAKAVDKMSGTVDVDSEDAPAE